MSFRKLALLFGVAVIGLLARVADSRAETAYTDLLSKIVVVYQQTECQLAEGSLWCVGSASGTHCHVFLSGNAGNCRLSDGRNFFAWCGRPQGSSTTIRCRQNDEDTTLPPPSFSPSYQQP